MNLEGCKIHEKTLNLVSQVVKVMQIKESHAPLTELAGHIWAMQMKY